MLISIQGELQHRIIKRRFARTNKRNYTPQLAAAEVRERFMRRVAQRITNHAKQSQVSESQTRRANRARTKTSNIDTSTIASTRYNIAETTSDSENLLEWINVHHADIAMKVWQITNYRCTRSDNIMNIVRTLFKDSKITSSRDCLAKSMTGMNKNTHTPKEMKYSSRTTDYIFTKRCG
jgi:hypothetical protein